MPQPGSTPILIYNSSTASQVPSAANLSQGELAINVTDKKLYTKDSGGNVILIASNGGDVTGPATATDNAIARFDTTTGKLIQNSVVTIADTTGNMAGVGTLSAGAITSSALTSGRVTYASTGGLLADSANLTFNGTTLTANNDASISGLTVGKGGGAVASNTAVGVSALAANTTGAVNTALGHQAGLGITTSNANVAIGDRTLTANSGAQNTAVGSQALQVTTVANNTAVGWASLNATTSGAQNVAVGSGSLQNNTTANYNTALGYQAGYTNSTGAYNVFIGDRAGYASSTVNYQTMVGDTAGQNTTGAFNTFIGAGAGYLVTSGAKNTILGGYNGNQGGLDIRTASNYIVLSDGDGNPRMYTNGSTDWYLNSNSGGAYATLNFAIAGVVKADMFYQESVTRFVIRNNTGGVYLALNATAWTANSDERKKDIIEPITDAANKVSTLRAVIGKYKTDEEGTRRSFLIAQDVLAVLPEAVDATDPDDLGVQYSEVIPLLVAAIKELKAEIDLLKGTK